MALLNANDLQFNYSWTVIASDDARVTGVPDSVLLNRSEGYEVLYFLNRLAQASKWTEKEPALKAERMINNHLPGNVRSHSNVWQWLVNNWQLYR